MKFEDLVKRALEVQKQYSDLHKAKQTGQWDDQQFMAGFVGDVGDLSMLIKAKIKLRDIDDVDGKLGH